MPDVPKVPADSKPTDADDEWPASDADVRTSEPLADQARDPDHKATPAGTEPAVDKTDMDAVGDDDQVFGG
jgi:hypothetical protein